MPTYIVKLERGGREWFMEWSTVVDAPVSAGMSRKAFENYYRSQYGIYGMRNLPERMARVDANGTSSHMDDSAREVVEYDRAGEGESTLTYDQIIDEYCDGTGKRKS